MSVYTSDQDLRNAQRSPLQVDGANNPVNFYGATVQVAPGNSVWITGANLNGAGITHFDGTALTSITGIMGFFGSGAPTYSLPNLTNIGDPGTNNTTGGGPYYSGFDSTLGTLPPINNIVGGNGADGFGGDLYGVSYAYQIYNVTGPFDFVGPLTLTGGSSSGDSTGAYGGDAALFLGNVNVTAISFNDTITLNAGTGGDSYDGFAAMYLYGNASLTTVSFNGNLVFGAGTLATAGYLIDLSNCGLTADGQTDILNQVLAAATTAGNAYPFTLNLQGGTTPTPTSDDMITIAAIGGFNGTVNTN